MTKDKDNIASDEEHQKSEADMKALAEEVYDALHGSVKYTKRADALIERIKAYLRGDEEAISEFSLSFLSHDELEAIDEYILQCIRHCDAMNAGLPVLSLLSFNRDRINAHEAMLSMFGLEDDRVAVYATKGFDFASTWDSKRGMYVERDHEEAETLLGFVLWKCRCAKDAKQEDEDYED